MIPRAAIAWVEKFPDGEGRREALDGVLSTWTQMDPEKVTDYALALPAGEAKDSAVGTIARQLASSDAKNAVNWFEKLPNESARKNAIEPLVSSWSETDPHAAAEFALSKRQWG